SQRGRAGIGRSRSEGGFSREARKRGEPPPLGCQQEHGGRLQGVDRERGERERQGSDRRDSAALGVDECWRYGSGKRYLAFCLGEAVTDRYLGRPSIT